VDEVTQKNKIKNDNKIAKCFIEIKTLFGFPLTNLGKKLVKILPFLVTPVNKFKLTGNL
jgi:hypothetical protein